jgi:hypothetical protein
MANDIDTAENDIRSLRLLLTHNQLYGRAKLVLASQMLFVVAVPGFFLVLQQRYPTLRVWAALYGLGIAIVDVLLLDALKTRLRQRAATVQEQFDCDVLKIPWSELKGGAKPDPEDILIADETDARIDMFRNWYARDVADVPEHIGRIICQRSNCWWDSRLRRWYRGIILLTVFLLLVIIIVPAVGQNRALSDFILGFLAPALPIILWGIREARAQGEAADRADRLKKFAERLWADTLKAAIDSQAALTLSREFQDEILAHRKQSPLVFDWFYRLFRKPFEQKMSTSVAAMVGEVKRAAL